MRSARVTVSTVCLVLLLLLTGCSMNRMPMKAPSASGAIQAPAGTTSDTVLSCAENTVKVLERDDDRWDPRVTRKDIGAGILETGDFEEENESGFRVRVDFDPNTSRANITLKGAGAYFVDLGVETAIAEFNAALLKCVSQSAGPAAK